MKVKYPCPECKSGDVRLGTKGEVLFGGPDYIQIKCQECGNMWIPSEEEMEWWFGGKKDV